MTDRAVLVGIIFKSYEDCGKMYQVEYGKKTSPYFISGTSFLKKIFFLDPRISPHLQVAPYVPWILRLIKDNIGVVPTQ